MNRVLIFLFFIKLTLNCNKLFAESDIPVGVILPLSGPYAHFGEAGKFGIDLALKKLKSNKLRLIYEDSQFDANKALSSAIKLIENDHVKYLIVLGTPTSTAVLPLSSKKDIPTFIWSASGDLSRKYKNAIRIMSSGTEQGKALAEIIKKQGYEKPALVASENSYSKAVLDGVLAYVKPFSVNYYSPDLMDFNIEIIKLKKSGVDAIGICLNTGQVPTFIKQLHNLGFKGKLFGCNAISSPEVIRALKDYQYEAQAVEGKVSTSFSKEFEELHPDTSAIWEAAAYYDLMFFLNSFEPDGMIDQCLETSAFGNSCIRDGEDGKFLDYGDLIGVEMSGEGFRRDGIPVR